MRWAMASWERIEFLNKWMLGDLGPRLQLDLMPGILCAAHFGLLAPCPLRTIDDYLAAGRAMQRFWLTATSLGLYIQPEMTPVIFSRYHRARLKFSAVPWVASTVAQLNDSLDYLIQGGRLDQLFFLGRLGISRPPSAKVHAQGADNTPVWA